MNSDAYPETGKTVVLLVNLGTPDAPTVPALRRYLAEFLSDPRVVELPRWLWRPVLYGLILNIRPRRSARAYKVIWTEQGSPLLFNTQKQAAAVETELRKQYTGSFLIKMAMRYGKPSVGQVLTDLRESGGSDIERLLVLPLYPQYSGSTTGSVFDAVSQVMRNWRRVPAVRFIDDYHDFQPYIDAMARHIRAYFEKQGRPQKLLFSFHGIPQSYVQKGDPYAAQCEQTIQRLVKALNLDMNEYQLVFQSRFGPQPWLQPYADLTLQALPEQGIEHVAVFCPGFAADCLETLEETAIVNRKLFLQAGGKRFDYIPALNDADEHIQALSALIQRELKGWD